MVTTGARLMPKFTFIGEHTDLYGKPDGTKVTYEFEVDSLEDVLIHADLFIRGCGYNPTGTLDYIPDEEYYGEPEWTTEEWNTPEDSQHSNFFFDTERNK
jgi:hypothetical protein